MAVEGSRIAAGPTVSKRQAILARVDLYSLFGANAGVSYLIDRETGATVDAGVSETLPLLGQIAVELPQVAGDFIATMWVYTAGGWAQVFTSTSVVNPTTGKPWDPLQNF